MLTRFSDATRRRRHKAYTQLPRFKRKRVPRGCTTGFRNVIRGNNNGLPVPLGKSKYFVFLLFKYLENATDVICTTSCKQLETTRNIYVYIYLNLTCFHGNYQDQKLH